jgi:hypothetical protein
VAILSRLELRADRLLKENIVAQFFIGGNWIELPAELARRARTRDIGAWRAAQYVTVRLLEPVEGVRVHTDGKAFSRRPASAAGGAWVAIGDAIDTAAQFVATRSLPGPFTHVGWALLPPDCIVNVGVCSPLFGGMGGGFQAEYVSGPPIEFKQAQGKYWHSRTGRA